MQTCLGRLFLLISILLFLAICLATPAGAILSVENVEISPQDPVAPGTGMNMTCSVLLSPSGAQTFVPGHTLVLSTDLAHSFFSAQVYVDRIPAALITDIGPVVFVNGYLLAYPSTQDVSIVVTLNGSVPPDSSGTVMVLRVEELDNSGLVIPASGFEVDYPVSGAATTTTTVPITPPVTQTTTPVETIPATTTPLGFWVGIAGVALAVGITMKVRRGS